MRALSVIDQKSVYFARGMDGRTHSDITAEAEAVTVALGRASLLIVDPYTAIEREELDPSVDEHCRIVVETDLDLLRGADALLVDLSIPDRSYIGCVCEIVYAYNAGLPVVIISGQSGNDKRYWLRYHSDVIVEDLAQAVAALADLLGS